MARTRDVYLKYYMYSSEVNQENLLLLRWRAPRDSKDNEVPRMQQYNQDTVLMHQGSQVGRGGDESILRAINLPQRITRNGNITFFIGICKEEIYFLENLRLSQLFSFPVKKNHSNWITSVFWWVSPSGLILTVS